MSWGQLGKGGRGSVTFLMFIRHPSGRSGSEAEGRLVLSTHRGNHKELEEETGTWCPGSQGAGDFGGEVEVK